MRPVLLFACVLAVTSADRANAQASLVRRPAIPVAWPAPAGHFQPRADDIPPGLALSPSLEDRAFDDKLKICRGC